MPAHAVNLDTCDAKNASDVLNCAFENHPDVLRAKGLIPAAQINKELAARRLNPDLDFAVNYNDKPDERGFNGELGLIQTIETSDKKSARKTRASAEFLYASILTRRRQEESAFNILTALNRLRQIKEERNILAETIAAFGNIIKRYENRPALPPEDALSLDVFTSALKNYKLEDSKLFMEEKGVLNTLKTATNNISFESKDILAYAPKTWPPVGDDINIENASAAAIETADIEKARADYLDAKTSSFGAFRAGPYIETRPGNLGVFDTIGVKAGMPIALYSNKKAVNAAEINKSNAILSYELTKRELKNNFERLKEQYELGVKSLKDYDIKDIEAGHRKSKKLFAGGRVSGAIFIEAHRQMAESIKIYHEYEMETLQALWNIYILQNRLISDIKEVYGE
jgi:hypothetical protein